MIQSAKITRIGLGSTGLTEYAGTELIRIIKIISWLIGAVSGLPITNTLAGYVDLSTFVFISTSLVTSVGIGLFLNILIIGVTRHPALAFALLNGISLVILYIILVLIVFFIYNMIFSPIQYCDSHTDMLANKVFRSFNITHHPAYMQSIQNTEEAIKALNKTRIGCERLYHLACENEQNMYRAFRGEEYSALQGTCGRTLFSAKLLIIDQKLQVVEMVKILNK